MPTLIAGKQPIQSIITLTVVMDFFVGVVIILWMWMWWGG